MKGILIQQKVFKSIDGKYAENVSDDKKRDNDEYAYSSIILNLSNSVIRKVGKQNSAKELWDRLEELFTETSLPSKLFLLENFSLQVRYVKKYEENIDEFTKLVQDIKLTGDKNIDDYTPIVLLNAIPDVYSDVKAAIKYGRDNVCLDTVINGLKSKEMDIKTNKTSQSNNEVNMVRGRTKNRNSDYKYIEGTVREEVEAEVEVGANLDPGMTETEMIKQKKEDAIIVVLKVITSKTVENQKGKIERKIIKKILML
ncbi:UNVERIFIED_CONTAM: hypothetical protein Sangu_2540100 [Sesamum angustifolium]|uniref:Retrovirus-related Pol polyprotein from transposon TNT 1-94 n=1 Tax=Sesamum angustifolium TaxID=2727405 RepID=A0AAW2JCD8_9LAMI